MPTALGLCLAGLAVLVLGGFRHVISMIRKQRDIGLGNLLGSSLCNITLVVGAAGLASGGGIAPSPELIRLDLPAMAMAVAVFACMVILLAGHRVSRLEGGGLIAGYPAFQAI